MKKIFFIMCITGVVMLNAGQQSSTLTASMKNRINLMRDKHNDNLNGKDQKKPHYEQLDARKRTRVHHAAIAADWTALDGYLAAGDDPNARDIYGNTPLHYVVMYDTRKANRRKALYTLLGFGADIYGRNDLGYTPTELASDIFFRRILLNFDQLTSSVAPTLGDI